MNRKLWLVLAMMGLAAPLFAAAGCDEDKEDKPTDIDTNTDTESGSDTDSEPTTDTTSDDTDTGEPLPSLEVGYSLFVTCLGVDHVYTEEFGGGHDIIVNPDAEIADTFDLIRDSELEQMGYAVLDYTAVDPTTAPAGKSTICISAMLMYDWEDEFHWNEGYAAYDEFKHELALILIDRVEKDVLPDLSTHVEVLEVLTPQTMRGFTSNPKGSLFGWHMIPEQSMNNRLPAQTPIDNLLLASAWTFPGGGQSAVLSAGVAAGTAIMIKENGPDTDPVVFPEVELAGMNLSTFEKLGISDKVVPVRLDPMYRIAHPEEAIDIPADADEYATMLKGRFPDQAEGIDKLWEKIRRIDRVMRVIMRYQYSGKDVYGADLQAFLAAIEEAGLTADLLEVQQLMVGTTLTQFLADYVDDPALISIFTQLSGFAGTGPDDVSAMFFVVMWASYHIGGYYYFEGGSQAVSDAMAEVIDENGGTIRLNTRAAKIVIGEDGRANRVITDDGICFNAKYVVSNANAPATMLDMVGEEYLPTDPTSLYHPDKLRWQVGEKKYPGNPLNVSAPEGLEIDAITSATPGAASVVLTQANHAGGFGKSDCAGCHATAHNSNLAHYTDAECTTCHGSNGSPLVPKDHALANCASCHDNTHAGLAYAEPVDCAGCHKMEAPATAGECSAEESYDVVIIGAGGGGLAAGAYLSQEGKSVIVLEQHHKVGGYMTAFQRGEYRFEVSLHAFDGLLDEPLK